MVGFIGLGNLGNAIAKRLEEKGEEIIVWNRTLQKAKNLGFRTVSSPEELWKHCDVVIMCLFESSAALSVLEGENGLLKNKTW